MVAQPIRILYTIPNFITAGSGGAMLNIIQRLDQDRFTPVVCVSQLGGSLDDVVRTMGIPLIEAPFTVPAKPYHRLYARARTAAQVFKPHGFDLWHSFHYGDDYTEPVIARLAGVKDWVFTKKNMSWNHRSWYLRSVFARKIVVQNSDMLKLFFNNRVFSNKSHLIRRGVDIEKFSPDSIGKKTYRSKLRIPSHSLIIGSVAHITPRKDQATLIKAVSLIKNSHLLLAGRVLEQNYYNKILKLIERYDLANRVHFLGNVDDIPGLLNELDIFVLSTSEEAEGSPVALLEAMACEKACVVTDVPGSRDLFIDKQSGLKVPPSEPYQMAEAISQLSESAKLREELGRKARKHIIDNHTIDHEVSAHQNLYYKTVYE